MQQQQPTVAFFGATGGCANACLALALQAGYHCSALARSPSKLHNLLQQLKVPESAIAKYLTVIEGDIYDLQAVQKTLNLDGRPVDLIVSGLGGKPRFEYGIKATLDNPTICQDGIRTILSAARSCAQKPRIVIISTTGLSDTRDVPLMMMPLYHWLLKVPHEDKKVMEDLVEAEMQQKPAGEEEEPAIDGYLMVRPSLLTNGEGSGLSKIRTGTDQNPAVGYTISRRDVGLWIFEKVIHQASLADCPYWGQKVTLTV
ncbi:hypothetical protein AbraIFM66951_008753 [Aspergillus brasiliensis]|uniref:NAD(P)-binding domain-containing protein n=1 Tax=Aspergillus brasiliensis TaxID=319629 RepID=A0A9W5YRL4_9EURO|nr:hypothetical protein AbraCBS73388_007697 [Aspergillus brasiliensis]GKZ45885.1 hypothetical protein AbraIFM66951_008753 [Aspergillus brasiliensis]